MTALAKTEDTSPRHGAKAWIQCHGHGIHQSRSPVTLSLRSGEYVTLVTIMTQSTCATTPDLDTIKVTKEPWPSVDVFQ